MRQSTIDEQLRANNPLKAPHPVNIYAAIGAAHSVGLMRGDPFGLLVSVTGIVGAIYAEKESNDAVLETGIRLLEPYVPDNIRRDLELFKSRAKASFT